MRVTSFTVTKRCSHTISCFQYKIPNLYKSKSFCFLVGLREGASSVRMGFKPTSSPKYQGKVKLGWWSKYFFKFASVKQGPCQEFQLMALRAKKSLTFFECDARNGWGQETRAKSVWETRFK